MTKSYLFYALQGEKMCFQHVLLNALDLHEAGCDTAIIFEGQSVKLPPVLAAEGNPLYKKALELGLIAGVCEACSRQLGVLEANRELGLPIANDMKGHAGVRPFVEKGYVILTF